MVLVPLALLVAVIRSLVVAVILSLFLLLFWLRPKLLELIGGGFLLGFLSLALLRLRSKNGLSEFWFLLAGIR
ncbi:MAG: hypothetical protein HQK56_09685 [Deltaproteobacteria bacterium]|nr:hypothetical protein [Deltaproteobacteria bacterium]